jgi:hypothetical protein
MNYEKTALRGGFSLPVELPLLAYSVEKLLIR